MKIGYARVSTTGQILATQIAKLEAAWAEKIFQEKKSGGSRAEREALHAALEFMREWDHFLVTRLDRLARSVSDLTKLVEQIEKKQVDFIVLDQKIDTSTPTGRLLFHMLAAIGEFERELIRERSAEGMARAKANSVKFGTRRKLRKQEVEELRREFDAHEIEREQLAKRYGISRTTLYRLCSGTNTQICTPVFLPKRCLLDVPGWARKRATGEDHGRHLGRPEGYYGAGILRVLL